MSRRDSAAMVPKTRLDLPEPDTPVKTLSCRLGMSRSTDCRLFSRAPRTLMCSLTGRRYPPPPTPSPGDRNRRCLHPGQESPIFRDPPSQCEAVGSLRSGADGTTVFPAIVREPWTHGTAPPARDDATHPEHCHARPSALSKLGVVLTQLISAPAPAATATAPTAAATATAG